MVIIPMFIELMFVYFELQAADFRKVHTYNALVRGYKWLSRESDVLCGQLLDKKVFIMREVHDRLKYKQTYRIIRYMWAIVT